MTNTPHKRIREQQDQDTSSCSDRQVHREAASDRLVAKVAPSRWRDVPATNLTDLLDALMSRIAKYPMIAEIKVSAP